MNGIYIRSLGSVEANGDRNAFSREGVLSSAYASFMSLSTVMDDLSL